MSVVDVGFMLGMFLFVGSYLGMLKLDIYLDLQGTFHEEQQNDKKWHNRIYSWNYHYHIMTKGRVGHNIGYSVFAIFINPLFQLRCVYVVSFSTHATCSLHAYMYHARIWCIFYELLQGKNAKCVIFSNLLIFYVTSIDRSLCVDASLYMLMENIPLL